MKKALAAVLVAALLTTVLSGCRTVVVTGSGNLRTEEYSFDEFDRVEISHGLEFSIIRADSYHVSITADDNVLPYIEISKRGDTLKIGLRAAQYLNTTARVAITMPELARLTLSGAAHGTMANFSSTDELYLEISGASNLAMVNIATGDVTLYVSGGGQVSGSIKMANARFNLSGGSSVVLEGSAGEVSVKASGGSSAELSKLAAASAEVDLSGESLAFVNASDTINGDLSGASQLSYTGKAVLGSISTSGGSTINRQ